MEELQALSKWLIMVFGISAIMRPYLAIRNLKLWDRGFALSFGLGTAISFFFCWIISALGIAKFDTPLVMICFIICAVAGLIKKNIVDFMSTKKVNRTNDNKITLSTLFDFHHKFTDSKSDICRFLLGFLLFSLIFLLGIYVKGFRPEITSSTEQFMDYGFIRSIYRQKVAFPEDIWFSGQRLNYYYLGQAATVYLCRLSGIMPEYGYPFMLYTIAAGLFTMVLSLASALIEGTARSKFFGGLAASFMTCFAGNGHYVYYGVFVPIFEKITGNYSLREVDYGYFYSSSTTYIGHNQAIEDYGKHEFPAYSFVLGDLHAHVLNLLFVIPLLALLIDYVYDISDSYQNNSSNNNDLSLVDDNTIMTNRVKMSNALKLYFAGVIDTRLLLISGLFALFMGTNYWDFPIYFIICGGVILFADYKKYGIKWLTTARVLIKGAIMTIIAFVLAALFNSHFEKMASEICICKNHSPFYKLLILWGFPVFICICFLIYLFRRNKSGENSDKTNEMNLYTLMLALVPCSIGLIVMPEIVYVKDIYGESYARFNTMFKFTYQSFLLTGIVIGIAIGVWLEHGKCLRGVILFVCCVIFSSYIGVAISQNMGNIFDYESRMSSNSCDFLMRDSELYPQMNAIQIINRDERDNIHILETGGTSYQPDNMISVFTGVPTYVGWGVHEWVWRGRWDDVGYRKGEVSFFYNAGDVDYCSRFIEDHDIDYIFVGPREYYNYEINFDGFANLPNVTEVFRTEDGIYKLYAVYDR